MPNSRYTPPTHNSFFFLLFFFVFCNVQPLSFPDAPQGGVPYILSSRLGYRNGVTYRHTLRLPTTITDITPHRGTLFFSFLFFLVLLGVVWGLFLWGVMGAAVYWNWNLGGRKGKGELMSCGRDQCVYSVYHDEGIDR